MASDIATSIEANDGDTALSAGEESLGAPPLPSRRTALLRSAVILVVLFITFGIILPRFVDYSEVRDAFLALTIEQIARLIIEMTGSKSQVVYKPLPEDDPKVRQPDITRARTLLGWEPKVDLREGLSHTIEYFRQKVTS